MNGLSGLQINLSDIDYDLQDYNNFVISQQLTSQVGSMKFGQIPITIPDPIPENHVKFALSKCITPIFCYKITNRINLEFACFWLQSIRHPTPPGKKWNSFIAKLGFQKRRSRATQWGMAFLLAGVY